MDGCVEGMYVQTTPTRHTDHTNKKNQRTCRPFLRQPDFTAQHPGPIFRPAVEFVAAFVGAAGEADVGWLVFVGGWVGRRRDECGCGLHARMYMWVYINQHTHIHASKTNTHRSPKPYTPSLPPSLSSWSMAATAIPSRFALAAEPVVIQVCIRPNVSTYIHGGTVWSSIRRHPPTKQSRTPVRM